MVWKDIERKMGLMLEDEVPGTAGGGAVLAPARFQTRGNRDDLIGSDSPVASDSSDTASKDFDPTKGSKGLGSFLNKPVFDSQQRITDASNKINDSKDDNERGIALNTLRKEEEFLKNLLGVQLDLDLLIFKGAKALAQALGQIVL